MINAFVCRVILVSAMMQMMFVQQVVPKSTGERCISTKDCETLSNGHYQWCEGCSFNIECSYKTATINYCSSESNRYWDDNVKKCIPQSSTCVDEYYPCPPGPSAPPQPVCESTGMGCLNSKEECPYVNNVNYQFCGNCTSFINCYLDRPSHYRCTTGTFYDAVQRKCVPVSKTCVECYAPCSPPTPEPSTTPATSPVNCPTTTVPPEKECKCGCRCSSKCE